MAAFDRPGGGAARAFPATSNPLEEKAEHAKGPSNVSVSGEVLTNSVLGPAAIYQKAAEMGAY